MISIPIEVLIVLQSPFSDIYSACRCGWCGNIVDEYGMVLEGDKRQRMIRYIENSEFPVVKSVNGNCCPNGDEE